MSQLVFDKYEIIRRLAVGGMGEIFLARQKTAGLDRLAILKSLLPDLAEQSDFIDQFLDEARVAATLNHPNIVSIYEVGAWAGTYFIAMEYINGESLAGLSAVARKMGEPIPIPVVARIVHDAAVGLHHAHCALDPEGRPLVIVHRDVTPQNIMVRTDGLTKVVDFGVARAANRVTRTATGLLKGKVAYMPPEQLSNHRLDGRADEWGLGIVFWESLVGQRLFRREDDVATIRAIVSDEEIREPASMVPGIPPELNSIVMRMLERDRERRFPHLIDVAAAIRPYLESRSVGSSELVVGRYVQRVAGARISGRSKDLTPSHVENFVISLKTPVTGASTGAAPLSLPTPKSDAAVPVASVDARSTHSTSRRLALTGLALATIIAVVVVARATTLGWRSAKNLDELAMTSGQASPRLVPTASAGPTESTRMTDASATVLQITSSPSAAYVYYGERLLGETPLRLGTLHADTDYQLVVDKVGYESGIVKLRLQRGEDRQVTVTLKKKGERASSTQARSSPQAAGSATPAIASAEGDGFLTVKTSPWTKVAIDGTPYGSTPLFKTKLPKGVHRVSFTNEQEGISETRTVRIAPGEVAKLDLQLKK